MAAAHLRGWLGKWVAQPLLQFLAIGAGVFALYAWLDDRPAPTGDAVIVVTPARVAQLAEGFEAVWRRQPTAAELEGLVADFIREEVYVREALALGLDRDDTVIRRRLRQKMEFLSAVAAETLVPTEAELRTHYEAHAARFTTTPRVAFEQIYLGEAPSPGDISRVRAALDDGVDPATLGARTLLPGAVSVSPPSVVDGTFGRGVFAAVAELEPHIWSGPIVSAYGSHLVRLAEHEPAILLPFESVRADVEMDWRQARTTELAEQHYENLRARYDVIQPEATTP
jgi:hypothetical protein